jgi:ABC-type transport system involved in cytochrome bd biosynthesis fused ATPase/permease subunit
MVILVRFWCLCLLVAATTTPGSTATDSDGNRNGNGETLLSWSACQVRHRDRVILDVRAPGSIHRGRLLGILGPSGAGKTTFLNAISGGLQETPTLKYTHDIAPPMQKTDTAFIYQEDAFFSQLTVKETLALAGALRLYHEADPDAVRDVIQFLGLDHVENAHVGDPVSTRGRGLSGGERKRLAVACEMLGTAPKVCFGCCLLLLPCARLCPVSFLPCDPPLHTSPRCAAAGGGRAYERPGRLFLRQGGYAHGSPRR